MIMKIRKQKKINKYERENVFAIKMSRKQNNEMKIMIMIIVM